MSTLIICDGKGCTKHHKHVVPKTWTKITPHRDEDVVEGTLHFCEECWDQLVEGAVKNGA